MEPEVITACENVCRDFYWVGPFTEWLRNLAIIAGVWVAYYQLNAWRREHISKRKAETAELLLSRATDLKAAIAGVRSPMEQVPADTDDRVNEIINMKWERLRSHSETFDRLRELQVLHEALVGSEQVRLAVEEFFEVRQEVYAALATLHNWQLGPNPKKEHLELVDQLQKKIYAMGKYDELGPRLNAALETLRAELLPEIRMLR